MHFFFGQSKNAAMARKRKSTSKPSPAPPPKRGKNAAAPRGKKGAAPAAAAPVASGAKSKSTSMKSAAAVGGAEPARAAAPAAGGRSKSTSMKSAAAVAPAEPAQAAAAAAAEAAPTNKGGRKPAASILATKKMTDGSTYAKDLTYAAGDQAVKPQSVGASKGKNGENNQGPDLDLTVEQRAKLAETGICEELVATPWAIIVPGEIGGSHLSDKESGFPCYIVTMAAPTAKTANKCLSPTKLTNEEFVTRLRAAHTAYGVHLQKICCRREKPRGHEHVHAVCSAGPSHNRYRWVRIANFLRAQYAMFLNFTQAQWASGVLYLSQGSSRKYSFDFVGDVLLWFAPGIEEATVEEICHGAGHGDVKPKKWDFLEFRAYVEKHSIKDVQQLHRHTNDCEQLDRFVNDQRVSASTKLNNALVSIAMRSGKQTTLLKELLRAKDRPCICGGTSILLIQYFNSNTICNSLFQFNFQFNTSHAR